MEITGGTTLAFDVAWLMTDAGELVTPDGEEVLTMAAPVQHGIRLSHSIHTCQNRTPHDCMCCKVYVPEPKARQGRTE